MIGTPDPRGPQIFLPSWFEPFPCGSWGGVNPPSGFQEKMAVKMQKSRMQRVYFLFYAYIGLKCPKTHKIWVSRWDFVPLPALKFASHPPPEISGGRVVWGPNFISWRVTLPVGVHRDLFCPARKLPPTKILIQKRLIPIFFGKNFRLRRFRRLDWTRCFPSLGNRWSRCVFRCVLYCNG